MSTDYNIRCECGEEFGEDDWRTPEAVNSLIEARSWVAGTVRALRGHWLRGVEIPLTFLWLEQHADHKMQVYDEYGYKWPREVKP